MASSKHSHTHHVLSGGFTIVELLIVIVVIGILAAIALVSYNGIQLRATTQTVQSDLVNARDQLEVDNTTDHTYPSSASAAGFSPSKGTTLTYSYNSSANSYCLTAVNNGVAMSIVPKASPASGDCSAVGMVGWWKLDGNANDSSGYNHNGTVYGASLVSGQNGQSNGAYQFNGTSSSYIDIPSFSAANYITVSAWVYPTASGENGYIIDKHSNYNDFQGSLGLASGTGRFELTTTMDTATYKAIVTTSALPLNTWTLLTGTYDGKTISLYQNGALAATIGSLNGIVSNSLNYTIGASPDHSNGLIGSVDDVRVYNRSLSASEAQLLYTNGAQ